MSIGEAKRALRKICPSINKPFNVKSDAWSTDHVLCRKEYGDVLSNGEQLKMWQEEQDNRTPDIFT